jgi:hypothetical protein
MSDGATDPSGKRASETVTETTDQQKESKRQATALSMLSSAALDEGGAEELVVTEGARNIFEEQLRQLQALQKEHAPEGGANVSDSDEEEKDESSRNKVKNKWLRAPAQQRGPRVGAAFQADIPN